MRFLFTTIQFVESDFYARVSLSLRDDHGHDICHVTVSRRATAAMRAQGLDARCLPELLADVGPFSLEAEIARIESTYDVPSLRDIYLADPACAGRDEAWCVQRTVRHVLALEAVFADVDPDVLVPEVGSETIRTVAQLVSSTGRSDSVLLFYTIFPHPLRIFVNTVSAPIVAPEEVRALDDGERREAEEFIAAYQRRDTPTLPHRRATVTAAKLRDFARHVVVAAREERDNEYLRPARFVTNFASQRTRALAARRLYGQLDSERPFVYFPLHVTDDFKVKKVIPHCVDQASLIRQVADALPQGVDLVLKEHPVSIGRNPYAMLAGLVRRPNVRLVEPHTSSHELIRRSRAVVVISSTVGLEALLYAKPVLTLGGPFYAGFGVTRDVDSFADLRRAVPDVLRFTPDRERILRFLHAAMRSTYAGAPAGVDASQANALTVARSLDAVARERAVA
ncbi:MAG: hypothetical protein H0T43_04090 [Solirubrobacterales bacterium]|nr:hypothetical protein [Solirubrobacterales bacterium]